MKLIIAVIQPERLTDVKNALAEAQVTKMTALNVIGCGQQGGYHESYRGAEQEINLLKKVELQIAVNDGFVEPTVDAIVKAARTGKIGDGKIFILDLHEVIRIRTGETDGIAIG